MIAPGFRHDEVLGVLTEKAVGFIDRHFEYGGERPFFLYFALPAPHTPVLPTGAYRGISAAGDYGDFVAQVDGSVGAVMQALEYHGAAGDTLLIVTSDNGSTMQPMKEFDHLPNGHLRGRKSDVWEGGHRVPFVARWPGTAPAGETCNETVCLADLLATCADIVGAELPDDAGEDSFSMLPALQGKELAEPLREATVHHSISGMFAVREGRWKLVLGRGSGGWTKGGENDPEPGQLYDLMADPGETTNLHAKYPGVVARLTALLERYRREGRSRPAPPATAAAAGADGE
jgi:arylsulfatase A-like enzyme